MSQCPEIAGKNVPLSGCSGAATRRHVRRVSIEDRRSAKVAHRTTVLFQDQRLKIRVGVLTGDAEWSEKDARGIAVHEASRILSVAGKEEILLTSVTKELSVGAGLRFDDRGVHHLKWLGAPHLFALAG